MLIKGLAFLAVGSLASGAHAQIPPPSGPQVALVTFSPGPAVYELFGHNGLWVRWPSDSIGDFYDYGRFSFGDGFVWQFARGRLRYWMGRQRADREFRRYLSMGRSIRVQELRLSESSAADLVSFLEWNAEPEHMYYEYNYFTDNCSTRVRDALARVLPEFRSLQDQDANGKTLRSMVRDKTRLSPGWGLLIELSLGVMTDRRITKWDEGFIPDNLSKLLKALSTASTVTNGGPIVTRQYDIGEVANPSEHAGLSTQAGIAIAVGLVALLLAFLRTESPLRLLFARLWLLIVAISGIALTMLWLGTSHTYAASNPYVLVLNPLCGLSWLQTSSRRANNMIAALALSPGWLTAASALIWSGPATSALMTALLIPTTLVLLWHNQVKGRHLDGVSGLRVDNDGSPGAAGAADPATTG